MDVDSQVSPDVSQQATCSILFFLLLLSLLRKPSVQNWWIKYLFSSFFPFPSVPSRERSDNGKGVGDKSCLDSPSHICCSKVRRVVGCWISLWNCWSSRAVRVFPLHPHPASFFLFHQCIYLLTLFYAGVKKLKCQKGSFPHTQAWESSESQRSLTDIWKNIANCPTWEAAPASSESGLIFPSTGGPSTSTYQALQHLYLLDATTSVLCPAGYFWHNCDRSWWVFFISFQEVPGSSKLAHNFVGILL